MLWDVGTFSVRQAFPKFKLVCRERGMRPISCEFDMLAVRGGKGSDSMRSEGSPAIVAQ